MSKSKQVFELTQEGVEQLRAELTYLKDVKRPENVLALQEARAQGDLSENADYDAAKDEQGLLELKISKLSDLLANSQIISADEFPNDKVYILSKVKVKNQANGKISDYQLVSANEADFERNKISVLSPMGKALIGKAIGEVAEIKVPAGTTNLEILDIYK